MLLLPKRSLSVDMPPWMQADDNTLEPYQELLQHLFQLDTQ